MGYHHWMPADIREMAWDDIVFAYLGTQRYEKRRAGEIERAQKKR